MASIKIIRRRIKSAQNIAQITRAMEMVAASKMKKSQNTALSGKPYNDTILALTRELASRTERRHHPLLSMGNQTGKILVIVISTNKGLCGGLNTMLFRQANDWFGESKDIEYITLGKKGQSFVVKSGKNLIADFSEKIPFTENVPPIAKIIVDGYIQSKYRQVYLVYNNFINALKYIPTKKMILPLLTFEELEPKLEMPLGEFLIEPSINDIFEYLLPHYLENQVREAIFEADASEHSARMIAMKSATDAASDLIVGLTLIFNKARQEKITYEIADMVTARMAVE